MRRWMMTTFFVILASALGLAVDSQWQYDKAKIASMSVAELETAADDLRGQQKDYLGAQRLFEEAVRRQPKNSVLFNKLGLVELQLRQFGRATSHFNKAVKLNPKYADALNNLGAAYFFQRDLDRSARFYRKALALDEARATFHLNLAACWEKQNKLNLALAEYARAVELDPEALMNRSSTGVAAQLLTTDERATRYFLLARVFAIRGDFEGSLEYLKKAKEEGYGDMRSVYKQQEFAKFWSDPRLNQLISR